MIEGRTVHRFIRLALCCLAMGVAELWAAGGSILLTRDELRARGVTVRRTLHDTPGASLAIEARIERRETEETYVATECRVLRETVAPGQWAVADENRGDALQFSRITRSEKANPGLLVLGKEVERAYLVFEFRGLNGSDESRARRYLLPVSLLMPRPDSEK